MTLTNRWTPVLAIVFTICFAAAAIRADVRTGPAPTPTPASTPAAMPMPPAATLASLQSAIRSRLFSPEAFRARVGIKIVSLTSGKVIFENDAEKYFMPASNMKNFTVAAALERLGPDFKFVTDISAGATPDPNGVIKGDLKLYGRGDISMSTSFDPAFPGAINYYRAIDMVADKISAFGVKRIEGDLVADESYFKGFAIPLTWEWDDLAGYYGTEISALPMNDNVVDVSVAPGASGSQCTVAVLPSTQVVRIVNRCTTGGADSIRITKLINQNVVEVAGTIPVGAKPKKESIAISHVAELFIDLLRQRLLAKGVTITGRARVLDAAEGVFATAGASTSQVILAQLASPPLSTIAAKTMKPSQNMYTETLLWTLGEEIGRKNRGEGNSSQLGLIVVKRFLKDIGVPDDHVVQYDGSGLSRHNLVTPSAVVQLYSYMAKSRHAHTWRQSLTVGGVDGTLRNRFKGTLAAGNIRGKTGTLDQVSALSGYLTTAGGDQLIVSILVNGLPEQPKRVALIDDIVVKLASFDGKIDQ